MTPITPVSAALIPDDSPVPLASISCTEELSRRPARRCNYRSENAALSALAQALANSPTTILQALAETMLKVFRSGSSGVSLLTKDESHFHWPAVAGLWKPHVGDGTPREFGPCGDVLDHNGPLLLRNIERRYAYFLAVTPPCVECLLVPFYVAGKAVGTLWLVAHDDRRKFDAEDLRQMESLGRFAAAAYQAVASLDDLEQRSKALQQSHGELAQHVRSLQESRVTELKSTQDAAESHRLAEDLNVRLQAEIAERVQAEESLRHSQQRLMAELDDARRLHEISTQLIQSDNAEALYARILDTLMAEMRSDFASVQLLRPDRGPQGELQLVGHRGFTQKAASVWQWVRADSTSTCGVALRTGRRCIVPDVRACASMVDNGDLASYLQTGILSAQTTPLMSRAGVVIGMISTHWNKPYDPTAGELRILDVLARQAADLIERNQSAVALHESEQRFRALFDLGPIGTYTTDTSGTLMEFNRCAVELWGREPARNSTEEIFCGSYKLQRPDGTFLPRAETPVLAVLMGAVERVRDAEIIMERPDGSRITIIANIVPLKNERGEITGMMNCFYDITPRKELEHSLRRSAAQFETLLRAAPLGLYVVDADFRLCDANPISIKVFGDIPGLIGRDFEEAIRMIWPKAYADEVTALFRHTLATGEPYIARERIEERKDSAAVESYDWQIHRIPLTDGRFGVVCYFQDISERVLAQRKISESELRYRSLFNTIDEGFCLIEMIFDENRQPVDYLFLEVNPAFARQTGIDLALGKRMREIAPDIESEWSEIFGRVALSGEAVRFMHEAKPLDRWFDVYASRSGAAEANRVAVVFTDITRRKLAESLLLESEQRYRNLFNSMDEGYCIIEMIFDEQSKPADYRFLEVNPTFEKHTGLQGAPGQRMRQLVPDIEQHWIDIYGQVALSGDPLRFVNEARAMGGRWFDVYAFRLGGPGSAKVAMLFRDITERQGNEIALRESEERYRNLFNAMDEGFCVIEMIFDDRDRPVDYRFIEVNPSFEKQSGMQNVIGRRVRELIPDLEQHWFEIYGKVARTGESVRFVNEAKALHSWLDVYAARLGDGSTRRVAVVFSNITDRIKAGDALRQSEERFRALFYRGPIAMFSCSATGALGEFNRRAVEIWGREPGHDGSPERYSGAAKLYRLDGSDMPLSEGPVARVLKGEVPVVSDMELIIGRPDGSRVNIVANVVPLKNALGEITGAINCFYDITERKRATVALRHRAELLLAISVAAAQLLTNESPRSLLGIIFGRMARTLGAEYYFNYLLSTDGAALTLDNSAGLNPGLCAAFARLEFEPCLSDPSGGSSSPFADFRAVSAAHEASVIKALGVCTVASHPLRVGGRMLGFFSVAAAQRGPFDAEELRFMDTLCVLVADSLERSRLTHAVTLARDVAERANVAKDLFMAALSHELRTPLTPVLLLAGEAANDPSMPPAAREIFAGIVKNVKLEARLIDDLLDLTRITHGKLALDLQVIDAHIALQDAIETVKYEVEAKHVVMTLNLATEEPFVRGDSVRLQQVFWNVLRNAVKFSLVGGAIDVQTRVLPHGILSIRVADHGMGITKGELDRLFSSFSQGDHASGENSHQFGGLGLGLSISRMLVELHDGTIRAESEGAHCGATFIIELPLVPRADPAPSIRAPERSPHGLLGPSAGKILQGQRILLVEDHEPTRKALTQLLVRRRYEVVAVGTVAEARSAAEASTFNLLMSDIGLPDGSGHELMADLRTRFGLIGIALTGYGMEEDYHRSKAAGFIAHLTKPVSIQALETGLAAAAAYVKQ